MTAVGGPQITSGDLQTLLVPFFMVLSVTDEPLFFKKVVSAVMTRILADAQPGADGSPARLPMLNLQDVAQDLFGIASSE